MGVGPGPYYLLFKSPGSQMPEDGTGHAGMAEGRRRQEGEGRREGGQEGGRSGGRSGGSGPEQPAEAW